MSPATAQYPVTLVCPECRGALQFHPDSIDCGQCRARYVYENGIPDLVRGGRFMDEIDPARSSYETLTNRWLVERYLQPTFQRLFPEPRRTRVLSLGCGVGIDIDLLHEAGFDIVGIDCGNRSHEWPERRHLERLYLANGKHLPFEDATFDLVYCGCVFPHIGVDGDSNRVTRHYWSERLAVAREMTRVLKPGGRIMTSSPNRWFPLDLFHGRDANNPWPRLNPPTSPFLLSAGDYRRLFGHAGCSRFQPLPVSNYWGFLRMTQTWKGKAMALPVDSVFRLVSTNAFGFLRTTAVNPWIVMLMRKS